MSPSYRLRNVFARKLANVRTLHISLDATLAYHCLASPCGTAIIRRKCVHVRFGTREYQTRKYLKHK